MADSIYEAEYVAVSDATKEAVWLRKFIDELEVAPSVDGSILLYYDNTGAIAQAKEPKSHQCTKYILHRYHLIRMIMDRGDIDLLKVNITSIHDLPNEMVVVQNMLGALMGLQLLGLSNGSSVIIV